MFHMSKIQDLETKSEHRDFPPHSYQLRLGYIIFYPCGVGGGSVDKFKACPKSARSFVCAANRNPPAEPAAMCEAGDGGCLVGEEDAPE